MLMLALLDVMAGGGGTLLGAMWSTHKPGIPTERVSFMPLGPLPRMHADRAPRGVPAAAGLFAACERGAYRLDNPH